MRTLRFSLRRPSSLLLLLLVLLAGALPRSSVSQPQAARYRVEHVATREQRSAIAATGAAIDAVGAGWVDITATAAEVQRIGALGFTISQPPRPQDYPYIDPGYHTYDQMVAEIRAVQAAHPAIVQLFSIGRSYEGRELWAAKISDHVQIDEDQPEALFVGHYHAREHLTVEMMLYILHMLADEYDAPGSEQVTALVDSREIYLVFDLNPDGGAYDMNCEEPEGQQCNNPAYSYQFWRKNRQPNEDGTIGIDLNRNHSYRWGGAGSSSYTNSETYHGPAPASAPEIQAMQSFINSRKVDGVQQIAVALSFHTYGELVLWPYGYTYEDVPEDMRPDDHAVLEAMGRAMAQLNGYYPEQASDLYLISGGFDDWAYGVHGIFAYTFEMYGGAYGFYPPSSLIGQTTSINRAAVLYLLLSTCSGMAFARAEAVAMRGVRRS